MHTYSFNPNPYLSCENHPFSLVMSPNIMRSDGVGNGLPIWNGKNVDTVQWDNYRYAVQGYCTSRGLSALLRPGYTSPRDQGDREPKEKLMRHWRGLQHLLRYLATSPKMGISFECEEEGQRCHLKGYSNADLATDTETRKSCAGYVLFLGKTPITWSSKTERSIVLSTTESERTALARGIRHANFIRPQP